VATQSISDEVKQQVAQIVERFNRKHHSDIGREYVTRFKGKYLYLDRDDDGNLGPVCRLEYTGNMKKWGFAIYKYSRDRYDPEEWMFPGSDLVDGTVEGALKAGMEAYQ
jgi:hypothetical protein